MHADTMASVWKAALGYPEADFDLHPGVLCARLTVLMSQHRHSVTQTLMHR